MTSTSSTCFKAHQTQIKCRVRYVVVFCFEFLLVFVKLWMLYDTVEETEIVEEEVQVSIVAEENMDDSEVHSFIRKIENMPSE